jgi:hypothetical protein
LDAKTFDRIVKTMLQTSREVLANKQNEYSTDDRLHNFRVAAALQQCTMKQALFGFLTKHLVSLADMCKPGKKYSDDIWDEKICDSINYLLLLKAVIVDQSNSEAATDSE